MKRSFSDFIRNASDNDRRIIYRRAMLKVIEYQQEIIEAAIEQSDRRTHLCKHTPPCPRCSSKQVQLLGIRDPAAWTCRTCRHHYELEPIAHQNEKALIKARNN